MADTGFLPKEKVKDFLEALAKEAVVYAPVIEGDIVLFKTFSRESDLCLDKPANVPPKSIMYPQCETLMTFEFKKNDPNDPKKVDIEVKSGGNYPKAVIFGCRPCDAKGFTIYDRVFIETDTADPYYKEHREKTTVISQSCEAPFAGCFCTAVGGSPADTAGSDVIMTEVDNGYYFEAVTEKGKAIMKASGMQDGSSYKDKAAKIKSEAAKKIKNPFPANATEKVNPALFNSDEFWEKSVSKCISCGACTYLCPTCYCFNITDEKTRLNGERIRTWDACMFNHFTLETSGHNPRPTKFKRYKNRVGHKFSYYPEKYNGVIACCGCGRCIRYCPVSVDISKIAGDLKDPKTERTLGNK
ncbi:MAG: 4Fe-4S dicluster domain-containing protein [Spirochaetota bacterium]